MCCQFHSIIGYYDIIPSCIILEVINCNYYVKIPINSICMFVVNIYLTLCSISQEMTDIVRAIYDMMGKYTYPALKTDAPKQHVDAFFQVS